MEGKKEGFTLLVALLIASLLITVSVAIYGRAYRDIVLSTSSKSSGKAFFAADSALECVLFEDIRNNRFIEAYDAGISLVNFSCSGISLTASLIRNIAQTGFTAAISYNTSTVGKDLCADVTYSHDIITSSTTIESRGYSTCNTADQRRLERALRTYYK